MKTIKFNILKKNRVYFACKIGNDISVKLKIDDLSSILELGEQELIVEDVSIRTRYGTDLIYQLIHKKSENEGIITLQHFKYNENLVNSCKNLGGKWDDSTKTWVFSSVISDEIEKLDETYNTDIQYITIVAKEDCYVSKGYLTFAGYTIAKGHSRDSGATLADDIIMTTGNVYTCGSHKNWATQAAQGSTFKIKISKNLLQSLSKNDQSNFEILEQSNIDQNQ